MKIYKILSLIIITLLTSCATQGTAKNSTYGMLGKWYSSEMHASYVQWNKNYAVTAAHFVHSKYTGSFTSNDLDLRFIKLNSENVPVWTNFKPREKVYMTGFPKFHEKEISGYISGQGATYMGSEVYQLVNAKVEQGMSGGPVFNAQREVIGIIVAHTIDPVMLNGREEIHSLFLPYSEIEKEWKNFQKINK